MTLIPIKDFFETKTRIKAALPAKFSSLIENLVEITFFQTINTIKSLSYPFGVISPSMSIIKQSKKKGAVFTFCDTGKDLNTAISDAVQELHKEHPILIIMPDLPFLNQEFFQHLFKETRDKDVLIIPSISSHRDFGTAALYLKQPSLLSFQFGENSSRRFQLEADSKNLEYRVLHYEPFARDLDTLNDVKYLKKHLTMVFDSDHLTRILEQLNIVET